MSSTQLFLAGYISAEQQGFDNRALFIKQTIFIDYGKASGIIIIKQKPKPNPNETSTFWEVVILVIPEILSLNYQL